MSNPYGHTDQERQHQMRSEEDGLSDQNSSKIDPTHGAFSFSACSGRGEIQDFIPESMLSPNECQCSCGVVGHCRPT
jgi:hypothetical protein